MLACFTYTRTQSSCAYPAVHIRVSKSPNMWYVLPTIHQVISPIKATAPAPPGKGKRHFLEEDDGGEDDDAAMPATAAAGNPPRTKQGGANGEANLAAPVALTGRPSAGEGNRPDTAEAAGAVAAAEIIQLESVVTMGDGKHNAFTCHCWGLEGALWAVNEPGQLVRVACYLCGGVYVKSCQEKQK